MAKSKHVEVYQRYIPGDEDFIEQIDPTPVEIPTRLKLPQRQVDRVRDIIRQEMSKHAQEEGWESFDEADDFSIDGEDPISPYEEQFEPVVVESPAQRRAALKKENGDGTGTEGVGERKADDRVGARPGRQGAGAAGGEAGGAAGSSGGPRGPSAGDEGSKAQG